jgi:hypothetical protein
MWKIRTTIYFFTSFSIVFFSCINNSTEKLKTFSSNNALLATDKELGLSLGDCFEFKDSINDFGLVLLELKRIDTIQEYAFFPVKLDNNNVELKKFSNGQIFISGFPDQTNKKGYTEGMMAFYFLSAQEFKPIYSELRTVGNLKIKEDYLNVTGGASALSIAEFKEAFANWENRFGNAAKKVTLSFITQ